MNEHEFECGLTAHYTFTPGERDINDTPGIGASIEIHRITLNLETHLVVDITDNMPYFFIEGLRQEILIKELEG